MRKAFAAPEETQEEPTKKRKMKVKTVSLKANRGKHKSYRAAGRREINKARRVVRAKKRIEKMMREPEHTQRAVQRYVRHQLNRNKPIMESVIEMIKRGEYKTGRSLMRRQKARAAKKRYRVNESP